RPFVVGPLLVAILDAGPLDLGQAMLEAHDRRGAVGAVLLAGHGQQLGEIGLIGGALLRERWIVAEIIIAVGQAEARLAQVHDHLGRDALVAISLSAERSADA